MSEGVFWTKVIFIIICFCEAFFAGCFATWSKGCRENPKILGVANAFASGVFLAIALIHILPEEAELWNEINPDNTFPLPYFLMWAGYTLILLVDKVLFDTSDLFKENDPATRKLSSDVKNAVIYGQTTGENIDDKLQEAVENYNDPNDKFAIRMSSEMGKQEKLQAAKINPSEISALQTEENQEANEMEASWRMPKKKGCNCTPFMLMIALSIHATFEGIACGLQPDFVNTMDIVIAILVHKGAAGSALGISLVKNFPDDFKLVRQLVFLFAIATPMGVFIGMLCTNAGEMVDVIMSSLAGGTFIYIGCTEIVVHEFSKGGYKVLKMIAYLCGAALITSLCFMKGA